MDDFKKYLQQNRYALDVDEPSPAIWERIERQQPVKKTRVVVLMTRWVAAACILVLAGIGVWSIVNDTTTPKSSNLTVATKTITPVEQPVKTIPETESIITTKELSASIKKETKKKESTNTIAAKRQDLMIMNNIESSFKQVINLQRDKVSTTPMFGESSDYFTDFKIQIKQLEKDEKSIKAEIIKRGMSDQLLNQLINIYQIKLNTLKQLQLEMNKINNRIKQNRAPVDSVNTYFINI
ncbi:MAG: hypothetical protein IBJ16_08415 [Chitinophagaceae bacterium]|nr:hypothetical protein [Chitinophagaceae bacterium]